MDKKLIRSGSGVGLNAIMAGYIESVIKIQDIDFVIIEILKCYNVWMSYNIFSKGDKETEYKID